MNMQHDGVKSTSSLRHKSPLIARFDFCQRSLISSACTLMIRLRRQPVREDARVQLSWEQVSVLLLWLWWEKCYLASKNTFTANLSLVRWEVGNATQLDSNSHLPPPFYTGLVNTSLRGWILLKRLNQPQLMAWLWLHLKLRGTRECGSQRRTAKWRILWF